MTRSPSPVAPSRGFALWLALLVLYFLLLPSAAETPGDDRAFSERPDQKIDQTVSIASH